MADRPHVGLVDAHAERVRGDDDRRLAGHEALLRLGACVAWQAGVVDDRLDVELGLQAIGQPLRLRAGARVDDPGERPRLGERGRDPAVDGRLVGAPDDGEREVRTVEAGRDTGGVAQPEAGHDVGRDLRRRGRGGGDDRLRAEPPRRIGEPEVVGPEVVAPLRDAVRLVDHEQPDPRVADALEEPGRREPLGSDVEQPQVTARGAVQRLAVRGGVLLGVDEADIAGRDPLDRLHLVLHQRHERRDHDRQVGPHQRRQLVAERLARAGRHDHEHVAAGDRRLDRLLLARPEPLEPEQLVQRPLGITGARDRFGRRWPEPRERDVLDGQRHGRATIPPASEGKAGFAQSCDGFARGLWRRARKLRIDGWRARGGRRLYAEELTQTSSTPSRPRPQCAVRPGDRPRGDARRRRPRRRGRRGDARRRRAARSGGR